MTAIILCLKEKSFKYNKCVIKYIYDMCENYMYLSDLYQSSYIYPVEFSTLEFEYSFFYKGDANAYQMLFYEKNFVPPPPRKYFNKKFSFFVDKNKFLPSFVKLFIYYSDDPTDNFCDVKKLHHNSARIPLLSLEEQKHFLIHLLN